MFPSHRNQSIDIPCKSADWFVYAKSVSRLWIKKIFEYCSSASLLRFLFSVFLDFNRFQPSVVFHIETSYFTCFANQMAVFYMKCNTGLKWFKELETVTRRCSLKMVFFKISQNLKRKPIYRRL